MEQPKEMALSFGICEITESKDELDLTYNSKGLSHIKCKPKIDDRGRRHNFHDEGELSRLFEAVDRRISSRVRVAQQNGMDMLHKNVLKKPVRVGISQASGIGISESVTLKQALRKLCISQASETAAMKRLSKPIGLSGVSEAGTIKRLYAAVVVQTSEPLGEDKGKLLEISVVPETAAPKMPEQNGSSEVLNVEISSKSVISSPHIAAGITRKLMKPKVRDVNSPASTDVGNKPSAGVGQRIKGKSNSYSFISSHKPGGELSKPHVGPRLIKPIFANKNILKKKLRNALAPRSECSAMCKEVDKVGVAADQSKMGCQKECTFEASNNVNHSNLVTTRKKDCNAVKPDSTPNSLNDDRRLGRKMSECLKSREKGECSQSSKSSMGDYSSSTSISDESSQSTSSRLGCRPHMSKDFRWTAIRNVQIQQGRIGLNNFKLLKRLGCGDIGTVYLAELIGSDCLFALKVMDNDFLSSRKKMSRAQTEREIMQILDHPFLPTLYACFTTDNLSCLVMEYCPGGDLHVLRQKQPDRNFSEPVARFYIAEVLLALEYLHMLGVVYRDLKPENILVREDGHIMLSDFDLSLRCTVSPTLVSSSSLGSGELARRSSGSCARSGCIDPLCLQPACIQVSCFTPHLISSNVARAKNLKSDMAAQVTPLPQLVAEPTEARSNSFVGTHEYLAPEIIRGEGHGSSVDWWTLGIFLYELMFGRTPFKGSGNEETLANIVTQNLMFPENPPVGFQGQDLIRGLLVKEPENRLGSLRGAAEIKQHPFFEGLNWALIRCTVPPETPVLDELVVAAPTPTPTPMPTPTPTPTPEPAPAPVNRRKASKCLEFRTDGQVEF